MASVHFKLPTYTKSRRPRPIVVDCGIRDGHRPPTPYPQLSEPLHVVHQPPRQLNYTTIRERHHRGNHCIVTRSYTRHEFRHTSDPNYTAYTRRDFRRTVEHERYAITSRTARYETRNLENHVMRNPIIEREVFYAEGELASRIRKMKLGNRK